ncbi:MAG TPA: aminoacyl-tRNA hydrolase [Longimicrobiaceae bacterium]
MAVAGLKVVVGLGNPGPEYSATRHNVGWWLADALAESWGLGRFKKEKSAAVASGRLEPWAVRVMKPLTYMNLSGQVLAPLRRMNSFDVARDLLVVVDDVALPPGRVRFRPEGSAGGHNGLKSIESALGTRSYPRLRIGVGGPPPGADLARWVLAPVPKADRQVLLDLFPELVQGVETWMHEGTEAAMNRFNR